MQLLLQDTTCCGLTKTFDANNQAMFYFCVEVKVKRNAEAGDGNDRDTDSDDDDDVESVIGVISDDATRNLASEMTEGENSYILFCQIFGRLSRSETGNYMMELFDGGDKYQGRLLQKLWERFQDTVRISVEIHSTTLDSSSSDDDDDDEDVPAPEEQFNLCYVSSKEMIIKVDADSGKWGAYKDCVNVSDLNNLSESSPVRQVRVRLIADINDNHNALPNASEVAKTTRRILEEGLASDVVIEAANGKEIKSHKCFLICIETASELRDKVVRVMSINFKQVKELPEFKEVFKNPADAIEFCDNLVSIIPLQKRKSDSEENEARKKSRMQ